MKCEIIFERDPNTLKITDKIKLVKAPNGERSILFDSIRNVVQNDDESLTNYYKVYTDEFKANYSNLNKDVNGETKFEEVRDIILPKLASPSDGIKPGIDYIFESNPELSKIGSKEQYSNYLDSIFPDSKVNDIVYRGNNNRQTNKNSSKLGIFFTDNINDAGSYSVNYTGDEFDDSLLSGLIRKFGNNIKLSDIENDISNIIVDMGGSNADIKKEALKYFNILSNNGNVTASIINVNNPKQLTVKDWFDNYNNIDNIKSNSDGLLLKGGKQSDNRIYDSGENQIVVFDPRQIHILGSNEDIEGFKKYVNAKLPSPATQSKPTRDIRSDYFDNDATKSHKEILSKITKSNHPLALLASKMLTVKDLDIPIVLTPKQYLYKFTDDNGVTQSSAGVYYSGKHSIELAEYSNNVTGRGFEALVLHEILHAFTWQELRKNTEHSKEFKAIYQEALNYKSSFTNQYAMSNIDEFIVAVFTDSQFMKDLQKIPSIYPEKHASLWEDVLQFFKNLLNLNKTEASLLDDAFYISTKIIESHSGNYQSRVASIQYETERIKSLEEEYIWTDEEGSPFSKSDIADTQIEDQFNLRNEDGSRKRYTSENKAIDIARTLNKETKDRPFKFTVIKVMGEKGDNRVYWAVKVIPRTPINPAFSLNETTYQGQPKTKSDDGTRIPVEEFEKQIGLTGYAQPQIDILKKYNNNTNTITGKTKPVSIDKLPWNLQQVFKKKGLTHADVYETREGGFINYRVSNLQDLLKVKGQSADVAKAQESNPLAELARRMGTEMHGMNESILNELVEANNDKYQLNTLRDLDFNLWFKDAFEEFKQSDTYTELQNKGNDIFLNKTKTTQQSTYTLNDSKLMVDKLVKSMMSIYHQVYVTQNRINRDANDGVMIEEDMKRHKPIFLLEKPFLDLDNDIAGTMDVFVIYSDGTAGIFDHKFTGMNIQRKEYGKLTSKDTEIKADIKRIRELQGLPNSTGDNKYEYWHYKLPDDLYLGKKEESWNTQIGKYADMAVRLYGIESIREARILPVGTSYTKVKTGNKIKNKEGKEIDEEAYNPDKSKVEIILTGVDDLGKSQIALEVEKTGDVGLDRFIQMLIKNKHALNEERLKKQQFDNPQYLDRINALEESIQALMKSRDISHISKSIEKLTNQIKSDLDNITFEKIITHLNDIDMFKSFIQLSSIEIDKLESAHAKDIEDGNENPYTTFKNRLSVAFYELDRQTEAMQSKMTSMISEVNKEGGYMSEGAFKSYNRQTDMTEISKLFTHLRESNHPIISLFSQLLDKVETNVIKERRTLESKLNKSVAELNKWGATRGLSGSQLYKDIITEKENLIFKYTNYKKDVFPLYSDPKNKVNNLTWFKNNFERIDKNEEIFQDRLAKRKEYFRSQYDDKQYEIKLNDWLNQNDITYNNGNNDAWFNQYIQHWLTPINPEEYYSPEYKNLLKPENKPLLDFYNLYTEQMIALNVKADFNIKSNTIPEIRKDMIDTMVQDGILTGTKQQLNNIKNFWFETDADDGFQTIQDGSRTGKQVPIFFDRSVGKGNKSLDLAKSLMLYSDFVNKYNGVKSIEHATLAMRELIAKTQGIETNIKGQIIRGADNKAILKEGSNKKVLDAFDTWVDYYIYGEKKKGNVQLNKAIDFATSATATKSIALNHISAISGHVNAELQLQMFTKKSNMLSKDSLWEARKERKAFLTGIDEFRKGKTDIENVDSKTLFASLFFEISQEDLSHEKANSVSASSMRKFMSKDPLYFFQRWSDDVIDNTALLAMLRDYGIDPITGKTYNLNRLKELYKSNTNIIESGPLAGTKYNEIEWLSLHDMIDMEHKINDEKHPAIINQFTGERMNDKTYTDFRRKVKQLISRAKGNMSSEDIAGYKTHVAGRLLMQYRNWIPATITERIKKEGYNLTMEQFEVGRWVAGHQMVMGALKSKWKQFAIQLVPFIDGNFTEVEGENSAMYTKYLQFIADNPHLKPDPANPKLDQITYEQYYNTYVGELKALASEIQFYLALGAMFLLFCMAAGDDELKENPLLRGTANLMERIQLEIGFYLPFLNPSEAMQLLTRKPIASTDVITGGMAIIANTGQELYDTLLGADWNKTVTPKLGGEAWTVDYAPRQDKSTWMYYSHQWIPPLKFANHLLGYMDTTKKEDTWWEYAFGDSFVK